MMFKIHNNSEITTSKIIYLYLFTKDLRENKQQP